MPGSGEKEHRKGGEKDRIWEKKRIGMVGMNDAGVGIKYIAQSINRSEKEMVGKREKIFSYRNYVKRKKKEWWGGEGQN